MNPIVSVFQLDLETLALSHHNAVIAQIGIDVMRLTTDENGNVIRVHINNACMPVAKEHAIKDTFCVSLSIQDHLSRGRVVEDLVMEWWGKQSQEVTSSVFTNMQTAKHAARMAVSFISNTRLEGDKNFLMASDISLDVGNFRSLFENEGYELLFPYNQIVCFRTIRNMFGKENLPVMSEKGKHNALADAQWQNEMLLHILQSNSPMGESVKRLLGLSGN